MTFATWLRKWMEAMNTPPASEEWVDLVILAAQQHEALEFVAFHDLKTLQRQALRAAEEFKKKYGE